jgi:hypothetical protein
VIPKAPTLQDSHKAGVKNEAEIAIESGRIGPRAFTVIATEGERALLRRGSHVAKAHRG